MKIKNIINFLILSLFFYMGNILGASIESLERSAKKNVLFDKVALLISELKISEDDCFYDEIISLDEQEFVKVLDTVLSDRKVKLLELINKEAKKRGLVCAICMQRLSSQDIQDKALGKGNALKCFHKFHQSCILSRIGSSLGDSCSQCRGRLNLKSILISPDILKDIDLVAWILDKGVNVNFEYKGGVTALLVAVQLDLSETVKFLIENGSNVNHKDKNGFTPLLLSIQKRNELIARDLLDAGADVELQEKHGFTPLIWAAIVGDESTVRLLIEHGACIDKTAKEGGVALMAVAESGNGLVAKVLIDSGADINHQDDQGDTPLIHAVLGGHIELVKLFVEKGACLDIKNTSGLTASNVAEEMRDPETITYLMDLNKKKMSSRPSIRTGRAV